MNYGKALIRRMPPCLCGLTVCVAVLLFSFAVTCAAEDVHQWDLFVIDDSGALWFIDRPVETPPGSPLASVWIRYMPVRHVPAEKDPPQEGPSSLRDYSDLLWLVDCDGLRFRTLKILRFDGNGRLIDKHLFNGDDWSQGIKGSIPEKIVREACSVREL